MNIARPVTPSLGSNDRRDNWWIGPLATALGLGGFGVYSMWAAFQNAYYAWGPYLSPFYSPLMEFGWMPHWFSPAFLILGAPLGFRATCYYYRKAYYRAFFFSPPGCAVGKGKSQGYTGERAFPFILQNLHRFFMYLAVLFIFILGYDAIQGMYFPLDGNGKVMVDAFHFTPASHKWGFGLGTAIMFLNVILLACYTFGCHSLRHLIGGKHDCFSCIASGGPNPPASFKAFQKVSWLNERHMQFAWASLASVGLTDIYIRGVAMGLWHDVYFLF
jgi:hypothetical protein